MKQLCFTVHAKVKVSCDVKHIYLEHNAVIHFHPNPVNESLSLSFSFHLFRVSSAGLFRRTYIQPTPVNMKAAASLTRSHGTSASSAALKSVSLWAWPWTVSD